MHVTEALNGVPDGVPDPISDPLSIKAVGLKAE